MINDSQEQIVRVAKIFGNGAHVFVPKDWAGEKLVLVRPRKKSLRERILSVLDKYLDSIIGVYLYGSYARGEQTEESDVDLFVIADKKIKIKAEGFEIICLYQSEIEKAIKLEPLLMYSIFSEAKPIINSKLLEELRSNNAPGRSDFREFYKDSRRIIKINEEFLQSEEGDYLTSEAIIYSLILRLRGLFIIKSLIAGSRYNYASFKSWIKRSLTIDFDSIYEVYRGSKADKRITQKIRVADIKRLVEFLKKELSILENG